MIDTDTTTFRPLLRGRAHHKYDFPAITFYRNGYAAYLNAAAREVLPNRYLRWRISATDTFCLVEPLDEMGPEAYTMSEKGVVGCPRELGEEAGAQAFRCTPTRSGLLFDLADPLPDF